MEAPRTRKNMFLKNQGQRTSKLVQGFFQGGEKPWTKINWMVSCRGQFGPSLFQRLCFYFTAPPVGPRHFTAVCPFYPTTPWSPAHSTLKGGVGLSYLSGHLLPALAFYSCLSQCSIIFWMMVAERWVYVIQNAPFPVNLYLSYLCRK